jgi:hypothetical protein
MASLSLDDLLAEARRGSPAVDPSSVQQLRTEQADVQSAAGIALGGVLVAAICVAILWKLLGGNVKGVTPVATGRRWMNWVVMLASASFLTKFFSQLIGGYGNPARALVEGVLGAVVLAGVAFALGAIVARLRGGGNSGTAPPAPSAPGPQGAPTSAPANYSTIAAGATHVAFSTASSRTTGQAESPPSVSTQNFTIDEDAIYAAIANELKTGATNEGLWTRLFAEYDGDDNRTKAAYIKQRAVKLISLEQLRLSEETRKRDEQAAIFEKARIERLSCSEQLLSGTLSDQLRKELKELSSSYTAEIFIRKVRNYLLADVEGMLSHNPLLVAITDSAGDSPLHIAIREKSFKMSRLLVENGSPLYFENMDGDTPLNLARKTGQKRIVELLASSPFLGVRINCPYCGASLALDSSVCSTCQKILPAGSRPTVKAQPRLCRSCNAEIAAEARACIKCGTPSF